MNNDTIAPAFEAGLAALRNAGISGTPRREADAMAESILEAEWEALGLGNGDELDNTSLQWWGIGAHEMLMVSYQEGLRKYARGAIERCMADHPPSEMEDLLEAAARAAELPPEDIVALVGEFCPIRHEGFALIYAGVEVRTWHAPGLVHHRFLKRHAARENGKFEPWYLGLLDESRGFFADCTDEDFADGEDQSGGAPIPEPEVARANAAVDVKSEPEPKLPQAPTNEEIIGWIKRLEGNPDTREVRAALHRMRVGAVPFISVEADTLTLAQAKTDEARGHNAAPTGLLRTVDYDPAAIHIAPTWLVKGLFPDRGLGMLVGESQSGKSFLAIHASVCVARGVPFFGRKVKPGSVLYIAAEGGSSVLPRIKAADEAIGGMLAESHLARKGQPPMARAPIKVMTETPNLSRDGNPAALARTLRAIARQCEDDGHPLTFVALDTYHAALCGGDEQSAADAGHALKPLREAVEELGLFVLIVHHPGKDIERGARGSSALRAAVDTEIELRVPNADGSKAKPAGLLRRATLTKQRDGAVGDSIHYRLNTVQLGNDEDGEPWMTCTIAPCDGPALDVAGKPKGKHDARLYRALEATLAEHGGGRAPLRMLRGYFNNAGPADEKEEARRKAFRRAFESACDAGLIETDSCEQWVWFSESIRDTGQLDTP